MQARTLTWSGLAAVVLGLGCTLIVGDFEECSAEVACTGDRVCSAGGYCVEQTIPEGCRDLSDAGLQTAYGPLTAENPIVLGTSAPIFTEEGIQPSEVQQVNAYALALEEINQRDGVAGRPFRLLVCDNGNDATRLRDQVGWLADEGAPAVLISSSSQVITAATELIPRGVLILSPNATSPEITDLPDSPDGGPGLVWRTAPSDVIQGQVMADLLLGTGPVDAGLQTARDAGVVYVNDAYGQGLNTVLVGQLFASPKAFRSFQFARSFSTAEAESLAADLNGFDPDVSVLVAFPEDVTKIVTAASTQPNLMSAAGHRWLLSDSAKDPVIFAGIPAGALEGSLGTAPAQGAGAQYSLFRNAFISEYGVDPASYAFVEHSYDAVYALALAAASASAGDPATVIDGKGLAIGMTKLSSGTAAPLGPSSFTAAKSTLQGGGTVDIEGASGPLDFDPVTGEATAPIEVWQVVGSGFQTVQVVDPGP